MGDSDGWKRGQRGFGTDKGFDVKTTTEAGKKIYGMIWPEGKTGTGGEPMPAGSAAKGSKGK